MSTKLKLDALIRVSQVNGRTGDEFRSPTQQREIITREAERLSADLFWHPPALDVSGKTMDRADLGAVLERVRTHQTNGLIVAFASRLSRARVDEALSFKGAMDEAGGRLVICDLAGIDLDSAAGELVFTNMLAFARYQWRQTAERWDMSRRDAIKAGISIGRPTFGYRLEDRRLVPDEHAPLVRELFERKAAGGTWLELARWMDQVAPRTNGGVWERTTIIVMIKCRTYLGELRSGKYVNLTAHEALVSPSLWRRAQNPPGRRTPRGDYLLTSLAQCAGCGRNLRGNSMGARNYRVYQCENRGCPSKSTISVKLLDAEVVAQFFGRFLPMEFTPADDAALAKAEQQVETLTIQVQTLAAVIPSHPLAVQAHQEALSAAEKALEDAEDVRDGLNGRQGRQAQNGAQVTELPWPEIDLELQRKFLRSAIQSIRVARATGKGPASVIKDRITIDWNPTRMWVTEVDGTTGLIRCLPGLGLIEREIGVPGLLVSGYRRTTGLRSIVGLPA